MTVPRPHCLGRKACAELLGRVSDTIGFLGRTAWPVVDLFIRIQIAKQTILPGFLLAADWNTALTLATQEYPVPWLDSGNRGASWHRPATWGWLQSPAGVGHQNRRSVGPCPGRRDAHRTTCNSTLIYSCLCSVWVTLYVGRVRCRSIIFSCKEWHAARYQSRHRSPEFSKRRENPAPLPICSDCECGCFSPCWSRAA